MASGAAKVVRGSFVGTGSAIEIKAVGFRPRSVKLYNVGGGCNAAWLSSMADASMQKTVDSGTGATDISFVTSGGVTPLAAGFSLGTDSDLNASTEVVHWEATE